MDVSPKNSYEKTVISRALSRDQKQADYGSSSSSYPSNLPEISSYYAARGARGRMSDAGLSVTSTAHLPREYYSGPQSPGHTAKKPTPLEKTTKIGQTVEHSKHLPPKLLHILYKILGIKKDSKDRAILGKVLLVLTILHAVISGVSHTVYKLTHIIVDDTRSSLIYDSVNMVLILLACFMGVYGYLISARLLQQKSIVSSIRRGTRTILKLNGIAVIGVISLGYVGLLVYMYQEQRLYDKLCYNCTANMLIPFQICEVAYYSNATFSFVALFWNMIMAYVVLSVARTHTIGLRKFIAALYKDGEACVERAKQELGTDDRRIPYSEDTDWYGSNIMFSESTESAQTEMDPEDLPFYNGNIPELNLNVDELGDCGMIMSNEELFVCYWKIEGHLRTTSEAFQRWMVMWIVFVFLWAMTCFIYWTGHNFTILTLCEFTIPLFLIPFMCSAYTEVNAEGIKIARCIYPSEERVPVQDLYRQLPLQMTVYNFPITVNTMAGVGAAFLFAVVSKVLFTPIDG